MSDFRITTVEDTIDGEVSDVRIISFDGVVTSVGGGGGAVSSVNGKTGVVNLTASDVGAATTAQGALASSAVQPGSLATVATSGAYTDLSGKPTLGTAAALDVPATGNATSAQVVKGTDSRLSDARTPTTHTHAESDVTGLVTDLAGKVPTTRTVNGHALSANVSLTNTDVGAAATSHTHAASDVNSGTLNVARLGTGTPAAGTYVDGGTGAWTALPSGSGGGVASVTAADGTITVGGTSTNPTVKATTGTTAGTVAAGNDSRLSDSRTPTAHASTHAAAGSDPITISESQVTNLTTDLAAKVPTTRTVNSKALSADITLTASDVSAVPTTRTVAGKALSSDITLADSDISPVAPNDQTGTTYTFVLADATRFVTASNASAQTYTVPPNSSVAYPIGSALQVLQKGAGQVTLVGGSGVTLNQAHGLKASAQWAVVTLLKIATDTWVVTGDTST